MQAIYPPVSLEEIEQVAEKASQVVQQIRTAMLAPTARKVPPVFNTAQLAQLIGVDKGKIPYRVKKGDLPEGTLSDSGTRRQWTLAEARSWIREYRAPSLRPSGAAAVTISIANFKGGVTKTTTAATLAQGLTLRGHKVLVIDTDPQGSLTTLFGVLPDTEVQQEDTILPLCAGDEADVRYAIRPTYWDGIDLIAAAPLLFSAEFLLPARQKSSQGFEFWRVVDLGLDPVRDEYDVIIIDTPPSLSYTTINALMASDGIVMPLPPNALDFASSAQFWTLFTDLCNQLVRVRGQSKEFAFVDVLLARVDRSDAVSTAVRQWIISAYGSKVLPIEIPKTSIAATASAEFGTVYDLESGSAQAKTLKRAMDAYDDFVRMIDDQVRSVWTRQLENV
jgi:chromosome partitioning protein